MSASLKESDSVKLYGPHEYAATIEAAAERIDANIGTAAKSIYEIGVELRSVKPLLRGQWEPWVNDRLGWSVDKADRLIAASVAIDSNPSLMPLLSVRNARSIFNLISSPSTPSEAVEAIAEAVEAGEAMGLAEVRGIVEDAKTPQAAERWTCPNCGGQDRDLEACKACHEPLAPTPRNHQRDFGDAGEPVASTASERRTRASIEQLCGRALEQIVEFHGDEIRSDRATLKLACDAVKDELIGGLKRYAKGDGE